MKPHVLCGSVQSASRTNQPLALVGSGSPQERKQFSYEADDICLDLLIGSPGQEYSYAPRSHRIVI